MCFVKSNPTPAPVVAEVEQPKVERKVADASITKNSQNNAQKQGIRQNLKTSSQGILDSAEVSKKTLLGE